MRIIKAPAPVNPEPGELTVFLGGSCSGTWRQDLPKWFADHKIVFLDPVRIDSYGEDAEDPVFREQYAWEQRELQSSAVVVMAFLADSKAPVSMMELAFHLRSRGLGGLVVWCEEKFWKRSYVEAAMGYWAPAWEDYRGSLVRDFPSLVAKLEDRLNGVP